MPNNNRGLRGGIKVVNYQEDLENYLTLALYDAPTDGNNLPLGGLYIGDEGFVKAVYADDNVILNGDFTAVLDNWYVPASVDTDIEYNNDFEVDQLTAVFNDHTEGIGQSITLNGYSRYLVSANVEVTSGCVIMKAYKNGGGYEVFGQVATVQDESDSIEFEFYTEGETSFVLQLLGTYDGTVAIFDSISVEQLIGE